MLISHKKFTILINFTNAPLTLQNWQELIDESIKQAPFQKRPDTVFDADEKAIILYCNDELWKYLSDIKTKGFDNLGIVEVAKIYAQIKKLLNPDGIKITSGI